MTGTRSLQEPLKVPPPIEITGICRRYVEVEPVCLAVSRSQVVLRSTIDLIQENFIDKARIRCCRGLSRRSSVSFLQCPLRNCVRQVSGKVVIGPSWPTGLCQLPHALKQDCLSKWRHVASRKVAD